MKRWEERLPICQLCGQKKLLTEKEIDAIQLELLREAHPEVEDELGDETGG